MSSQSNFEEEKSGQEARLPLDVNQAANSPNIPEQIVAENFEGGVLEVGCGKIPDDGDLLEDNDPLANLYRILNDLDLAENNQLTVDSDSPKLVGEQLSVPTLPDLNAKNLASNDLINSQVVNPISDEQQTSSSSVADSDQAHLVVDSENRNSAILEVADSITSDSATTELESSDPSNLEYIDELYDRTYSDKLTNQDLTPKLPPLISLLNIRPPDPESGASPLGSSHWIVEKERQINDLASSLNSLLPLVVELSQAQADSSREHILNNLVPVIDQVIQKRSTEDQQKMAEAIANILPKAIQQEIRQEPKSIGQAIAPELALSITEQIRLDENAIAEALGSEMGKAIKNQIEKEREAMVDALYPVIGSTISKYMAEVVESINVKVDNALSLQGIQRKIRAKVRGVSEAELILRESLPCTIQAAFLIQNNSGLVIAEFQPQQESQLEGDLLAGMLTAIRSFGDDCITSNSELDEIDYGNFKIMFETAGYCYLAVVVNGEADNRFGKHIQDIFSRTIQKYGDEIKNYQGEQDTNINTYLKKRLAEFPTDNSEEIATKSPKTLYWLVGILLLIIFVPWGILHHRNAWRKSIENNLAVELDASPELSVYRLIPKIKKQTLFIQGRVPSPYLANLVTQVATPIAKEAELELANQIVAVKIPPDPTLTKQEVKRTVKIINQQNFNQNETDQNYRAALKASYQDQTVNLEGVFVPEVTRQKLIKTFLAIPGVENVVFLMINQLPQIETRIYFASGASNFPLAPELLKLEEVLMFLKKYPSLGLKITSHSDNIGSQKANRKLGRSRVQGIYQNLINRGISPDRLKVVVTLQPPPDIIGSQAASLKRCIRFEPFGIVK